MKTCRSCRVEKQHSDFQRNARRRDDLQADCKPCRKVIDAESWRRNGVARQVRKDELRRQVMAEVRDLNARTPCVDCGQLFHPAAMQFDHRPGEVKRGNVSALCRGGARRATWREIEKCDLVCANCHAVRTYERLVGAGMAPDEGIIGM